MMWHCCYTLKDYLGILRKWRGVGFSVFLFGRRRFAPGFIPNKVDCKATGRTVQYNTVQLA